MPCNASASRHAGLHHAARTASALPQVLRLHIDKDRAAFSALTYRPRLVRSL